MNRIENHLLKRIQSVRPMAQTEQKLSVIIDVKDNRSLEEITTMFRQDSADNIKTYRLLNSVTADIPVSKISRYEMMPGVEKLWDGKGDVIIPPLPDTGIQPQLTESVPLIMQHPEYVLPDKIPGTDIIIDGTGTRTCIIDSGIDPDHPDLKDKIAKIKDFTEDGNGIDYTGHGTHVAGIIAGSGRTSGGRFRGVAPGSSLYIAKVFSGNTGQADRTAVLDAIEWAVDEQIDVINMSLGSFFGGCDGTCPVCRMADAAVEYGITVVISAGNNGPRKGTITCPGNSRKTVAAGAVDNQKKVAIFSSRGPTIDGRIKPDLSAPGVAITAPRAQNTEIGPPVSDHYVMASGTSMSAPHIAGAASLLIQIYKHFSENEYGTPVKMEPKDLKNFMMQGSIEIDGDGNIAGRGFLNIPLCVKSMEDSGRIPEGVVGKKGGSEAPQKPSNISGNIEMAVQIAQMHLEELGIPLDCNLHFYNDRNEVVLSRGEKIPQERVNIGSALGLYKPSTQTAYVRLMPLPLMVSTIAHEVGHHFMLSRSTLGKKIQEMDVIYEIHKEGKNLEVREIIGDVSDAHLGIARLSAMANEGFATWCGHHVLRKFAANIKDMALDGGSKDMIPVLIDCYEHLASDLDGRLPHYYQGRLEYRNIEEFFGEKCVPFAALVIMNMSYETNPNGVLDYVNDFYAEELDIYENKELLRFSPDLRLIALSKVLPGLIAENDDISKINDPEYLDSAIRRLLGDDFLDPTIKLDHLITLKPEISGKDELLGEILAEIAYGKEEKWGELISELKSVNPGYAEQLFFMHSRDMSEPVRRKAKEMLAQERVKEKVRLGEAVAMLEYVQEREEMLGILAILKDISQDAGELFELVDRNLLESGWREGCMKLKNVIRVE